MRTKEEGYLKLDYIGQLPQDWNGNGAEKFSKDLINKCRRILDSLPIQPEIFPTGRDSVQLEYHQKNGDYLEFEVYEGAIFCFLVITVREAHRWVRFQVKEEEIQKIVDIFYNWC